MASLAEPERRLPRDLRWFDLFKPTGILLVGIAVLLAAALIPEVWDEQWTAVAPAGLIILIIALMIWPSAGTDRYFAYKRPLFIATIVLELWIMLAGVALVVPSTVEDRAVWFQIFLVTFFLVTVINSLPALIGEYRSGLFFRPDLLFGGGAYLARGEIFVALGVKLLVTDDIAQPIWNWWGLAWAVVAMVIMVPLRGILKMRMRRARTLGLNGWMGTGPRAGLWLKEAFLFFALFALVYGFANVYMGKVPFTWVPGDPTGKGGSPEWWGLLWLGLAFVILVPVRGWYKMRIAEPPTVAQDVTKQVLLWLGFLPLIYGFLLLFQGHWLRFYGFDYYNFWWGVWVTVLGFLMVVPLRVLSLRDEFRGTVSVMVARMADLSEHERRLMMGRRLQVLATMPDRPRKENLKLMMRVIHRLPPEPRATLVATRTELVANAPEDERAVLMGAMAAALADMETNERVSMMTEVMSAVSALPDEQRRLMMDGMAALLG